MNIRSAVLGAGMMVWAATPGATPVVAQEVRAAAADEAKGLNERGVSALKAGRYAEAAPLLERALAIFEKALGKDHPNTKVIAANLAELRKKLPASPKP
jgi:hypothetical protein